MAHAWHFYGLLEAYICVPFHWFPNSTSQGQSRHIFKIRVGKTLRGNLEIATERFANAYFEYGVRFSQFSWDWSVSHNGFRCAFSQFWLLEINKLPKLNDPAFASKSKSSFSTNLNFMSLRCWVGHGKTHLCIPNTVKPVCNDHLYNKIYYLWFIQ